MKSVDRIDWHLSEAECLLQLVTYIAELDDEQRAQLRPAAITLLYVMADMLHAVRRAAMAAIR